MSLMEPDVRGKHS